MTKGIIKLNAFDAAALVAHFTELYLVLPSEYRRNRGTHEIGYGHRELYVTWSNANDSSKNFGLFVRYYEYQGDTFIGASIHNFDQILKLKSELKPLHWEFANTLVSFIELLSGG